MRGIVGGCGCFFFVLIIAIASFVLGIVYGPKVKEEVTGRTEKLTETFKQGMEKVSEQMKEAQEAARSLSGEKSDKDSSKSDKDSKSILKKYF